MILDILANAQRYTDLGRGFVEAFEFLRRPTLAELPVGRYDIAGNRVYAMVIREPGRRLEGAMLEIHEKYADIQLVLAGTDNMGWKPKQFCKQPSGDYNGDTDIQFFTDKPDAWLATGCGAFAVFFPEDAHMPMISSGQLHKVVVKIRV